jgi:hypothetical protein
MALASMDWTFWGEPFPFHQEAGRNLYSFLSFGTAGSGQPEGPMEGDLGFSRRAISGPSNPQDFYSKGSCDFIWGIVPKTQ